MRDDLFHEHIQRLELGFVAWSTRALIPQYDEQMLEFKT